MNRPHSSNYNLPITSKNDLGSIPFAEVKSVPVFFKDCIAARTACTMATQDTSEKTSQKSGRVHMKDEGTY